MRALVETAKVLVCVGPGGVGKTSVSAAIGIEAARAGRRVLVLTIDPAKRLANALGLENFSNAETDVPAAAFGGSPPKGRVSAMMLDIKSSWDEVVRRYHPDPKRRDVLLNSRFYGAMSTALAGSQEYMAMEQLYALAHRKEDPLDLIVLDTPPAANALDFLEAPSKMLDALDNDATRWLIEPYHAGGRVTRQLFGRGSSFFIRSVGRLTGAELLNELAELLSCFDGMFDGFRARARAVRQILSSDSTRFIIVSAPRPVPIAEAGAFADRLRAEALPIGAIVLNRCVTDPFSSAQVDIPALECAVQAAGGRPLLAQRLVEVAEAQRVEAEEHAVRRRALVERHAQIPVYSIPELMQDVHDVRSLDALAAHLFDRAET